MSLLNSKSAYKAIQKVIQNAESTVNKTQLWIKLHNAYNIGSEQHGYFSLTARDRIELAQLALAETGYDPRNDNYDKMIEMTRTQSSLMGSNEKVFSSNPREPFIEVRFFDGSSIDSGYRGILVEDAAALTPDVILSIENFDTFVWINEQYLRSHFIKTQNINSVLVVFRGDTRASPKAVKRLRQLYDGAWWHFGDFDPKGLQIAVSDLKSNVVILPELNMLMEHIANQPNINDSTNYYKQQDSLNHIRSLAMPFPQLSKWITAMDEYKLSVCQEPITSRGLTLVSIRLS